MSTVVGNRLSVYICFMGKYAFPDTINGVDILRVKEGVLSLYEKHGEDEVHLGSYPLCNIKSWVIEK